MTALEKMRGFIESYPSFNILSQFRVDFTDQIPGNGGIFPSGLVEISRKEDVLGDVTITNQYNFGLYYVFAKVPGDDTGATINADWLMDFQEWVQEQSATGQAPVFGDVPKQERIMAQNGALYDADDEGAATYMAQISAQFVKIYKNTDPWYI